MNCIYCGGETRVVNSRLQKKVNHIWRRRHCEACGNTYTTIEAADYQQALRLDRHGKLVPFVREQLLLSIYSSLGHRGDAALGDALAITDTVMSKLVVRGKRAVVTREEIIASVVSVLNNFDKAAAVQYAAYHKLSN